MPAVDPEIAKLQKDDELAVKTLWLCCGRLILIIAKPSKLSHDLSSPPQRPSVWEESVEGGVEASTFSTFRGMLHAHHCELLAESWSWYMKRLSYNVDWKPANATYAQEWVAEVKSLNKLIWLGCLTFSLLFGYTSLWNLNFQSLSFSSKTR
jgi:hypothetical protein